MERTIGMSGVLRSKVIRAPGPGIAWKLRNTLRPSFLLGFAQDRIAKAVSKYLGITTITTQLSARLLRADGSVVDYGILGYRSVTDAGVAMLVDDWQAGTPRINTLNYHGCGTGGTAENVTQTTLITESTTALNPDSTRATGTATQPSAPVFQSVGTLTFDAGAAITEHGLFSQAAIPGGVLWDRTLFTVINVLSGDSIQFTYQCTVNAGG